MTYTQLLPLLQEENSYAYLTKRDPRSPILGLHFHQFVYTIIQEDAQAKVVATSAANSQKESGVDHKEASAKLDDQAVVEYNDDPGALEVFTTLMQYYIYGMAKREGLPMLMRGSFGFPHAAIIECASDLRIAIGALENNAILIKYVEILSKLPDQMAKCRVKKEAIKKFLENNENIENLEKLHPLIMRKFRQGEASLLAFIEIAIEILNVHSSSLADDETTSTAGSATDEDQNDNVDDKKTKPPAGHQSAAASLQTAAAPHPPAKDPPAAVTKPSAMG